VHDEPEATKEEIGLTDSTKETLNDRKEGVATEA
jgi:hypothetical protein